MYWKLLSEGQRDHGASSQNDCEQRLLGIRKDDCIDRNDPQQDDRNNLHCLFSEYQALNIRIAHN